MTVAKDLAWCYLFRCTLGQMYSHLLVSETEYIPMIINCMEKHLGLLLGVFLY